MIGAIKIIAFYKFIHLSDFADLRKPLLEFLLENDIKGTILLAPEGINGTVSGSAESIDKLIAHLNRDERFGDLEFKLSSYSRQPFKKTKVKLKKEIISFGKTLTPNAQVGQYVSPEEWNSLLEDKNVIVLDTRNNYEVEVGSFPGAINPNTESFREVKDFADAKLNSNKNAKIAIYCTGGIRCEKFSAYLLENGFRNVYHLKGGILKYLEKISDSQNRWQGTCYVFDDRRALKQRLEPEG
jgi:UPF0176 protein